MNRLIEIVAKLRSPEGCPWDKKQTHPSLIPYLLEETWEVIDAIEQGNTNSELREELGDVLLQIALHAQIASEEDRFDLHDVVNTISDKMVQRHPHVFEDSNRDLSDRELRHQWNRIKASEKKSRSINDGIPVGAPSLLNALTISKRAASLGFDWETPGDVLSKVEEELEEVREEMTSGNLGRLEEEIGDLLFTVTNLARVHKINPEVALKKGNDKFIKRFATVEKAIAQAGEEGREITMDEMQAAWLRTK